MGLVYLGLLCLIFFTSNVASHGPDIDNTDGSNSYNLTVHLIGTAVVFIVSVMPVICILMSAKKINKYCFNLFKFFGIGVVISTCWCHLISEGFEDAEPLKEKLVLPIGFIPMITIFLVHAVDAFAHSKIHNFPVLSEDQDGDLNNIPETSGNRNVDPNVYDPICKKHLKGLKLTFLEAGILIHSVIIGMSLGITQINFYILLLCVCFHQIFEGLAIGSYIRDSVASQKYKVLLYTLYSIATPMGMITGILFQLFYNYSGIEYKLVEKVLNLISSGLLIYTSYVELMANDMQPQSETFRKLSLKKKGLLMFSAYLGAMAMAVIGIWM